MLGVAVEGVSGGLARTTEISIINNAREGCAYLAPPLDFLSLCFLCSFRLCLSSSDDEDEDDDDELEDETLRRRACGSMMGAERKRTQQAQRSMEGHAHQHKYAGVVDGCSKAVPCRCDSLWGLCTPGTAVKGLKAKPTAKETQSTL